MVSVLLFKTWDAPIVKGASISKQTERPKPIQNRFTE